MKCEDCPDVTERRCGGFCSFQCQWTGAEVLVDVPGLPRDPHNICPRTLTEMRRKKGSMISLVGGILHQIAERGLFVTLLMTYSPKDRIWLWSIRMAYDVDKASKLNAYRERSSRKSAASVV